MVIASDNGMRYFSFCQQPVVTLIQACLFILISSNWEPITPSYLTNLGAMPLNLQAKADKVINKLAVIMLALWAVVKVSYIYDTKVQLVIEGFETDTNILEIRLDRGH